MVALPREVVFGAFCVAAQLVYSQLYPLLAGSAGAAPPPAGAPPAAAAPAGRAEGERLAAARERPGRAPGEAKVVESTDFASSTAVRKRRGADRPKYRVGQVLRDKVLLTRGVVVGWDETCHAPEWWRVRRLAQQEWAKMPHYLLLADHRDLSEELESMGANSTANLTFYAPEVALEPGATPLVSPLMPRYFHFLDSSQDMYVPRPDLARLYPDDVGSHYRDHASKEELPETDAKGQPLLRVVQDGRLIAHGRPVPVLRKGMFLVATEGIQDQMFGQSVILLLNHSDYEGTLGVIVNKPIEEAVKKQTLRHAQSNLDAWRSMGRDYGRAEALLALLRVPGVDLRMGGPVGMMEFPLGTAHVVLHPFPDVEGAQLALAGSGSGADQDLFASQLGSISEAGLADLARRAGRLEGSGGSGGARRVVVFAGASGWGPRQLAGEIRGGLGSTATWAWAPASPREVVLAAAARGTSGGVRAPGGLWQALINSSTLQRLEQGS